jgi:hypothetical protein
MRHLARGLFALRGGPRRVQAQGTENDADRIQASTVFQAKNLPRVQKKQDVAYARPSRPNRSSRAASSINVIVRGIELQQRVVEPVNA